MNPFRPSWLQGAQSSRRARKVNFTAAQRHKLIRRQSSLENLEERQLLTLTPVTVPTVFGVTGAPLTNVVVGEFTDNALPSPATSYLATVTWGDGTTSAGTVVESSVAAGVGTYYVEGSHTYTTPTTTPISVAVQKNVIIIGTSTTLTTDETINASGLLPTADPVNVVEGTIIPAGTEVGTVTYPAGLPAGEAAGLSISGTVTFTDSAGNPISVGVTSIGPGGVDFQNGNTLTLFTSTNAAATAGFEFDAGISSYTLAVTDNNTVPDNAIATGTLTVSDAPLVVVSTPLAVTASAGTPVTVPDLLVFQDGTNLLNPTDAPLSDYTVTINWGDGTQPQTVPSLDITQPGGSGTPVTISGTHTYADYTPGGNGDIITITVNDIGGSTLVAQTVANVAPATLTDNTPGLNPITTSVNSPLTNVVVAEFTTTNTLATASDFTAAITSWGDGTPPAGNPDPGVIVPLGPAVGGGQTFAVLGSHTYTVPVPAGTFITTTITDIGGTDGDAGGEGGVLNTTEPVTVDASAISIAAAPVVIQEGPVIPAGTVIGTFTDANYNPASPPTYTATVTIPGATAPTTLDINPLVGPNGNTFELITATDTDFTSPNGIDEGVYQYTVDVTSSDDPSTPAAETVGTLTVTDAPLTADATQPPPVTANVGQSTGVVPLFTFDDADPVSPITDFTATINWGDGTPDTVGTIIQPGGIGTPYTVEGSHTYAQASPTGTPYVITVNVLDDGGSTVVGTNTATVAAATLSDTSTTPVVGAKNQLLNNVPLATFVDSNPNATPASIIASINWGDGTAPANGTVTLISTSSLGSVFEVTGSHTYTDVSGTTADNTSPFTITVSVADSAAYAADPATAVTTLTTTATISTSSVLVTVLPVSGIAGKPVDTGTGTPPVAPGQLIATFTDTSETNETTLPAGSTVTVDWGDGTADDTLGTGVTIAPLGGGQFGVYAPAGGHDYVNPGIYTITVTVGDSDPATGVGANFAIILPSSIITIAPIGPAGVNGTGTLPPGTEGQPLPATASLPTTVAPVIPPADAVEVATFQVNAPGQSAANYSVLIDWGDGSPESAGQVFDDPALDAADPGTTNFIVTGEHTYVDARTQPYLITVYVTQNAPAGAPFFLNDTQTVHTFDTVTINDAALSGGTATDGNIVPAGPVVPTIYATKNQPLTNVPVATFVDSNPDATAAEFTATINWGDGDSADANTQVVLVGGLPAQPGLPYGGTLFAVYGSHNYTSLTGATENPDGSYSFGISVSVQDVDGAAIASPTLTTTATVSQSPISVSVFPLAATAATPIPAGTVVATFTDANGDEPISNFVGVPGASTINWGDGTTDDITAGMITDLGGGNYEITTAVPHTYAKPGAYQITVTIYDTDPVSGVGAGLALVSPATFTVAVAPGASFTAAAGQPATNVPLATITTTDPTATAASFTATVNWGDGTPDSVGLITGPTGGPFDVTGTHTYATAGTYPVTVTISDGLGDVETVDLTATVTPGVLSAGTGIPVYSTTGQPITNAPLGTFTDSNPLATAGSFTATIHWGDPAGTVTSGVLTQIGGGAGTSSFSISGSLPAGYPTSGTYPIVITVTPNDGGAAITIDTTATVTAAALSVTAFPISATEGSPTPAGMLVGTFTEGNGSIPASEFAVSYSWGDGTTDTNGTGVTVVAAGGGTYNVYAPTHTYDASGSFIVTLTVTDLLGPGPISAANLATVAPAALTVSGGYTYNVTVGNPIPADTTVATFTYGNPVAPLSDFTATINWGDGIVTSGVITQPGGIGTTFDVTGGPHTYLTDGTFPITVTVTDTANGKTGVATDSAVVAAATITISPTPVPVAGYENSPLTNVDVATFTSTDPLSASSDFIASINWGDGTTSAGTIVEDASKVFHVEGSHTYTKAGAYSVTVSVSTASLSPTLLGTTVSAATIASNPLLITPAPVFAVVGQALPNAQNVTNGTIVATFTDSVQTDPLSALSATITWGNGQTTAGTIITTGGGNYEILAPATPSIVYSTSGTYPFTVTVTDANTNATAFSAVGIGTVTVKAAALTVTPIPVTGTQGVELAAPPSPGVDLVQFTDPNLAATTGEFSAIIDWGDGSPESAGQIVQPGGAGTPFYVIGNHIYAQPSTGSGYTVTVTIHDTQGPTVTTTTTATIAASTITGTAVTINGTAGQPLTNAVVADFSDSGLPGPLSSYSATISWGDGTASTTGTIVPLGGNQFEVEGSHTFLLSGTYAVTVTIDHNGAPGATVISTADIAAAALSGAAIPVFATEGAPFTGNVAIFTDANPNDTLAQYPAGSAVINWGNGDTTAGTVVQDGAAFEVTAVDPTSGNGYTYPLAGSYAFSVTVTNTGGATLTVYGTATVADAALTVVGNTTLTAPLGPTVTATGTAVTPTFTVATFTDAGNSPTNPDPATAADYSATINWGDGVTTAGTITVPPSGIGFQVTGTHLYGAVGTYNPIVTVTDDTGGARAQAVSTIVITDATLTAGPAVALTEVEAKAFTAEVGTFTYGDLAATPGFFTATINWGDGTAANPDITAGTIVAIQQANPGTINAATQFAVTGSHTYATFSPTGTPYPITVTISDNADSNVGNTGSATGTVTDTATATVQDAPLTAATTSSISGVEGITTGPVLVAVFTDANPNSTLADFTTAPGSVTINWGDGTGTTTLPASDITAVGSPTGVTYEVTAAHTYTEEGQYAITVTATDTGGSTTVTGTTANIADAPLYPAVQPTVTATEGVSFTLPVGSFVDLNPDAPVTDYTATIDWGDGSPRSTGLITPYSPTGAVTATGAVNNVITLPNGQKATLWLVTGSHNYIDPTVGNGSGTYTITINVYDSGGSTTTILNPATVAPQPITLTGMLNPASDTGESDTDAITADNTPNFIGTTEPYATVRLWAAPVTTGVFTVVGSTQANAAGQWSITTGVLANGRYTIWADALNRSGLGFTQTQILPNATQGDLVIDTVDPQVDSVNFDRLDGTVFVTYSDPNLADGTPGSGLNLASITDAANYHFYRPNSPKQQFLVTAITPIATGIPGQAEVALTLNGGKQIKGGFNFNFTIFTASPSDPSGVQDVAGNGLQGTFYGTFPSGNGSPANFNARLIAFHNRVLAPATNIGSASPVTAAAVTSTPSTSSPAIIVGSLAVHDAALDDVTVPKKHKKK